MAENAESNEPRRYADADHIRARPAMYIGDLGPSGLHSLVYELVDNSLNEILSAAGSRIHVQINVDGCVSVADDGRGIPVELHPAFRLTILELLMTVRGAWAEARSSERTYQIPSYGSYGGHRPGGLKKVTALSDRVEVEVCCDGRVYRQSYGRGRSLSDVFDAGTAGSRTGTTITIHPDPDIFCDARFEWDRLEARLRELAFLNKGVAIKLTEERTGKDETFHYPRGVVEFVEYLNRSRNVLHRPISIEKAVEDPWSTGSKIRVEAALQFTAGEEEHVRCYANTAYNQLGGTHLTGLRSALTRTLKCYATKEKLLANGPAPIGEDFRKGLTGIVSVHLAEPQFESQAKLRLNNPELEGIVARTIREELDKFLMETPDSAQQIIRKIVQAAKAREAKKTSKSEKPPK